MAEDGAESEIGGEQPTAVDRLIDICKEQWELMPGDDPSPDENAATLRERLKAVNKAKAAYGPHLTTALNACFLSVQDTAARGFLTDILFSRMLGPTGRIDDPTSAPREAQAMASELGLEEGWRGEEGKGMIIETPVFSVLEGKLRAAPQPQP